MVPLRTPSFGKRSCPRCRTRAARTDGEPSKVTVTLYDEIGRGYREGRRSDPRIAAHIDRALEGAASVLNIGSGTGSYEPAKAAVVAIEASLTMNAQRPADIAPCVNGRAERLPFGNKQFSHCLSILSMHHWTSRCQAAREMVRVTRDRLIVLTWDPAAAPFWLTRDYFPAIYDLDRKIFPSRQELTRALGALSFAPVPIPADCVDGFLGAFWRRPDAYLDPRVRANMSTFSKIAEVEDGLARLRRDLESGIWNEVNHEILTLRELDIGYRLVTATIDS